MVLLKKERKEGKGKQRNGGKRRGGELGRGDGKKERGFGLHLAPGYNLPTGTLVQYSYIYYENCQIIKEKSIYYFLHSTVVNILPYYYHEETFCHHEILPLHN